MSSNYFIANKVNKTLLNLGKWYLWEIAEEPDALFDLEYLTLFVTEDCWKLDKPYKGKLTPEEYSEHVEWVKSIPSKLHAFVKGATVKDLLFFDDSTDHLYIANCLGYKLTDSVYGQEDVDSRNKNIEARRITHKHSYCEEEAKKYFDYNKFVD